ncbi:hydroxyisourate hydrolase [Oricola sp.]|uniref:hydroxyisourate hydrolase n=1 Tax=Oricola sp. TaxID=1979950 RepID=UPI003BA998E7
MRLTLSKVSDDGELTTVKNAVTNSDGRTDEPLLGADEIATGTYEIRFEVAPYFAARGDTPDGVPFLGVVPVRFAIADASAGYHVPLLVSPWSYSTYRGS